MGGVATWTVPPAASISVVGLIVLSFLILLHEQGPLDDAVIAPTICHVPTSGGSRWLIANDSLPLVTNWTYAVHPNAETPYPRPHLARSNSWLSLNGLWRYMVTELAAADCSNTEGANSVASGEILVPYPMESSLSGVGRTLRPTELLWYSRNFTVPVEWLRGQRLLLHMAADWLARVWVNDRYIGSHRGGYDTFTLDITDVVAASPTATTSSTSLMANVTIAVWDPSDRGTQPRGKQSLFPEALWYTASSGLWQTVWIEPVSAAAHITDVVASTARTLDAVSFAVSVAARVGSSVTWATQVALYDSDNRLVGTVSAPGLNVTVRVPVTQPQLWSPHSPHMYRARVSLSLGNASECADEVTLLFGMRTVSLSAPSASGQQPRRVLLNNEPVFLYAPLDQGFWPDGLYTAPTDDALLYELTAIKQLGFNAVRKHIKTEPARWYHYASVLGLLVLQDMPSGAVDAQSNGGWLGLAALVDGASDALTNMGAVPEMPYVGWLVQGPGFDTYRAELPAVVRSLQAHTCIVSWTVFNEAWGQFDTVRMTALVRSLDTERLIDSASGWWDVPAAGGDFVDAHIYPGPGMPYADPARASLLGEFGGLGLAMPNHTWLRGEGNWGYATYHTPAELLAAYSTLLQRLASDCSALSGAVYTQWTDVEGEINGLMTYDRAMFKMGNVTAVRAMHEQLLVQMTRVI